MYMSVEEMRRSYQQAKDQKKQLSILADLNCCDVEDIKELLRLPYQHKNPPKPRKMTDLELMVQSFYEEMERIDREIKRLETRYTNLVGVIEALSRMVEADAK